MWKEKNHLRTTTTDHWEMSYPDKRIIISPAEAQTRWWITTHCWSSRLELAVEELQAVVEDVLIGGVQTGLDTVPYHVGSPGWTLQLQDLHTSRPQTSYKISAIRKVRIQKFYDQHERKISPLFLRLLQQTSMSRQTNNLSSLRHCGINLSTRGLDSTSQAHSEGH